MQYELALTALEEMWNDNLDLNAMYRRHYDDSEPLQNMLAHEIDPVDGRDIYSIIEEHEDWQADQRARREHLASKRY